MNVVRALSEAFAVNEDSYVPEVRRFPMEPFLETLWGPISAYLCPLGVAILRY